VTDKDLRNAATVATQYPHQAPPPQRPKRSLLPIILLAIGVTAGAGILAYVIASKTSKSSSDAPRSDESIQHDKVKPIKHDFAGEPSIDQLLAQQEAAFGGSDRDAIRRLLAASPFGFGLEANEVAVGRDAMITALTNDFGNGAIGLVSKKWTGTTGTATWYAAILDSPKGKVMLTELAVLHDGRWVIAAWHWGTIVTDAVAYDALAKGKLPVLDPIPDANASDEPAPLVRSALATRAAYIDAISKRADAFAFGSAGETMVGGDRIKRGFSSFVADFKLHDGLRIDKPTPDVAYAAANVDFTNKAGTETFRVLLVLLREGGQWSIVSSSWSNGGPL
jgi:hypothetical protein